MSLEGVKVFKREIKCGKSYAMLQISQKSAESQIKNQKAAWQQIQDILENKIVSIDNKVNHLDSKFEDKMKSQESVINESILKISNLENKIQRLSSNSVIKTDKNQDEKLSNEALYEQN